MVAEELGPLPAGASCRSHRCAKRSSRLASVEMTILLLKETERTSRGFGEQCGGEGVGGEAFEVQGFGAGGRAGD